VQYLSSVSLCSSQQVTLRFCSGVQNVVTQRTTIYELTKTFRRKVSPPNLRAVRRDTALRPEAPKFCPPHFLPDISFCQLNLGHCVFPPVTWSPQAPSAVSSLVICCWVSWPKHSGRYNCFTFYFLFLPLLDGRCDVQNDTTSYRLLLSATSVCLHSYVSRPTQFWLL